LPGSICCSVPRFLPVISNPYPHSWPDGRSRIAHGWAASTFRPPSTDVKKNASIESFTIVENLRRMPLGILLWSRPRSQPRIAGERARDLSQAMVKCHGKNRRGCERQIRRRAPGDWSVEKLRRYIDKNMRMTRRRSVVGPRREAVPVTFTRTFISREDPGPE